MPISPIQGVNPQSIDQNKTVFKLDTDTSVSSPVSGHVLDSDPRRCNGYVRLQGNDGYFIDLCNIESSVASGSSVFEGQKIGQTKSKKLDMTIYNPQSKLISSDTYMAIGIAAAGAAAVGALNSKGGNSGKGDTSLGSETPDTMKTKRLKDYAGVRTIANLAMPTIGLASQLKSSVEGQNESIEESDKILTEELLKIKKLMNL
jgi:hypothetical protein